MLPGHVLMPRLVLCDDVPKQLDGVFLVAHSCFHRIRVYGLGTYVYLILKHVQCGVEHDRTTSVLLHVQCTQLQVIASGLFLQLLHVPVNLSLDLVCMLIFGEGMCICSLSSSLLTFLVHQPIWRCFLCHCALHFFLFLCRLLFLFFPSRLPFFLEFFFFLL